jgi:TonB family protein
MRLLQLSVFVLVAGSLQFMAQSSPQQSSTNSKQTGAGTVEENKEVKVPPRIRLGKLIHKVPPVYPPAARMEHIQGTVRLQVLIDKEGKVAELEPVSGPKELIPAALDAVRQWRYKPALLDGKPVAIHTEITVDFKSH